MSKTVIAYFLLSIVGLTGCGKSEPPIVPPIVGTWTSTFDSLIGYDNNIIYEVVPFKVNGSPTLIFYADGHYNEQGHSGTYQIISRRLYRAENLTNNRLYKTTDTIISLTDHSLILMYQNSAIANDSNHYVNDYINIYSR